VISKTAVIICRMCANLECQSYFGSLSPIFSTGKNNSLTLAGRVKSFLRMGLTALFHHIFQVVPTAQESATTTLGCVTTALVTTTTTTSTTATTTTDRVGKFLPSVV